MNCTITKQYIAGFFDGEGCVGIYPRKDRKCHYLMVQMVQNKSLDVISFFNYIKNIYGGNSSDQITLSGNIKCNWQLGSYKCVNFLSDILPYLILKKNQVEIAIAWQKQRPLPIRDKLGRIKLTSPIDYEFDKQVAQLLKLLKHKDIDLVMEQQSDLVEIVTKLTPLCVVKG